MTTTLIAAMRRNVARANNPSLRRVSKVEVIPLKNPLCCDQTSVAVITSHDGYGWAEEREAYTVCGQQPYLATFEFPEGSDCSQEILRNLCEEGAEAVLRYCSTFTEGLNE